MKGALARVLKRVTRTNETSARTTLLCVLQQKRTQITRNKNLKTCVLNKATKITLRCFVNFVEVASVCFITGTVKELSVYLRIKKKIKTMSSLSLIIYLFPSFRYAFSSPKLRSFCPAPRIETRGADHKDSRPLGTRMLDMRQKKTAPFKRIKNKVLYFFS